MPKLFHHFFWIFKNCVGNLLVPSASISLQMAVAISGKIKYDFQVYNHSERLLKKKEEKSKYALHTNMIPWDRSLNGPLHHQVSASFMYSIVKAIPITDFSCIIKVSCWHSVQYLPSQLVSHSKQRSMTVISGGCCGCCNLRCSSITLMTARKSFKESWL